MEPSDEKFSVSWQAAAYDFSEKSADWLWALVIVAISG